MEQATRSALHELGQSLLVYDGVVDLERMGALEEGDARFQAPLGGARDGRVEGWLLQRGVAARLTQGAAVATLLLGPFAVGPGARPIAILPGGRTTPVHTLILPGARLRVALRSVEDSPGRRRHVNRLLAEPTLRGRRCGLRRDDVEPRAVRGAPESPSADLILFVPPANRLLLVQASLEPSPI
jgi:hypothetical protein